VPHPRLWVSLVVELIFAAWGLILLQRAAGAGNKDKP
jgi:hypothetical protein